MTSNNIISVFLQSAEMNAEAVALVHDSRQVTYGQLRQEVVATASYYQNRGIRKGDRVLVFVPMRIDLYRIVLALFYIGACPVFVDEWVSVGRLNSCCKLVGCKAIIADRKLLWLAYFVKELRKIDIKIATGKKDDSVRQLAPAIVDADDTALITFTTGTTGTPKAANRTHGFLHAQNKALQPYLQDSFQLSLVTLPIVVLINLGLGKTTVLPPKRYKAKKPETIEHLAAAIERHSVETIIASPSVFNTIGTAVTYPFVKKVLTGGGPVFPTLAKQIIKVFPNAEAHVVYGSTEAEPISSLRMQELAGVNPGHILHSGLPVGSVHTEARVAIISYADKNIEAFTLSDWSALQLPVGTVGEIVVSGAHVLNGYINNPEAIARNKIICEGVLWHRTGDAGRLDEDGHLYFYGRCSEIIVWNHDIYYPVLFSNAFIQLSGATNAALLVHKGKLTLAVASQNEIETGDMPEISLRRVKHIPVDPRHHTKVDYAALAEKLK